jgi:hypothetical protein
MFGIDYPKIGQANPLTGQTLYTVVDTYNSALENNGASQPLGSLYQAPLNAANAAKAGGGLNNYYKYVRYNPTASQVIQAGPALLYWKDETFTTVTGLYSEAYLSANQPAGVAGWLLYNTTSLASAAAAAINGNFCWMLVGGFLAGAFVTAATVGQSIYGVATGAAWATTTTAPTSGSEAGYALTAAASNLADIYVPFTN